VSAGHLIPGIAWLVLGLVYFVFRDRIAGDRHSRGPGRSPRFWRALGALYVLLGVLWLVDALV
jgi:hypothetical protein